jgi:hypothetical protein
MRIILQGSDQEEECRIEASVMYKIVRERTLLFGRKWARGSYVRAKRTLNNGVY